MATGCLTRACHRPAGDPQHAARAPSTIFRVRNRQSLNFGALPTLNFPAQGTPSPNRIWSWQNARYDTWRNILTPAVYPNASGTPSPLVIRFDEDGDGDPSDGTPHFMQMTRQLGNTDAVWTYVVQPTDQMAVDGGVGGPFTNGGRGKTWDNNFECFLYGPLVDPAPFGAMTIDSNNPFGAALPTVARQVFSPGRLKFQYEISRDIVCWSKRTRLTTDPNSDNPDTPFDTDFPSVRHPITFDVKKMISTARTRRLVRGLALSGAARPAHQWVAYRLMMRNSRRVIECRRSRLASRYLEGGSGAARGRAEPAGYLPRDHQPDDSRGGKPTAPSIRVGIPRIPTTRSGRRSRSWMTTGRTSTRRGRRPPTSGRSGSSTSTLACPRIRKISRGSMARLRSACRSMFFGRPARAQGAIPRFPDPRSTYWRRISDQNFTDGSGFIWR